MNNIRYSDTIKERLRKKVKNMVKAGEVDAVKALSTGKGKEPILMADIIHIAKSYEPS